MFLNYNNIFLIILVLVFYPSATKLTNSNVVLMQNIVWIKYTVIL